MTSEAPLDDEIWDPDKLIDETPSADAVATLHKQFDRVVENTGLTGFALHPDETDKLKIHILFFGTFDTPYAGCPFYLIFKARGDHPNRPPLVKLITNRQQTISLHPLMEKSGKICMDILGTSKTGKSSWNENSTLTDFLTAFKAIFSVRPYNFSADAKKDDDDVARSYSNYVRHESLVTAVDVMSNKEPLHDVLKFLMFAGTVAFRKVYAYTIDRSSHLDGQEITNPLESPSQTGRYFRYKEIGQIIKAMDEKVGMDVPEAAGGVYIDLVSYE